MQKVITPLPIQLGSITPGTNTLSLYLDANKLLGGSPNPANGTPVTDALNGWRGLSGNDNVAYQSTPASQPVYETSVDNGNGMVLFDGTDDVLAVDSSTAIDNMFAAGGVAIFVIKPTGMGGASQGRLFSQSGGNSYLYLTDESGGTCKIGYYRAFSTTAGEWVTNTRVINLNEVNIVVISYNSSNVANDPIFYINSKAPTAIVETSTPVGTAAAATTLRIGNSATTSRSYAGYMGDIAMLKAVFNTMQIANLVEFYAKKYNKTYTIPLPLLIQGGSRLDWIKFSDTSTIVASGNDIVSVYNKSGNGNNPGQPVVANRPKTGLATLNDLNVASFTAASVHFLTFPNNTPVSVPFTTFVVAKSDSAVSNVQGFLSRQTGTIAGQFSLRRESSGGVFNAFAFGSGALSSQAAKTSNNSPNIHTVAFDNGNALGYQLNNDTAVLGAVRSGYDNAVATQLVIGASNTVGGNPLEGYVVEIISIGRILTEAEKLQLSQYLSEEYNVLI